MPERASPRRPGNEAGLLQWSAMTLPVVGVRVPVLQVNPAGAGPVVAQARWAAQALMANLPPRERLLYYTGLGLAATTGVLEWPVAAAAGIGVWVAARAGRRARTSVSPA